VIAASRERRGLLCKADELNFLSGPGKGVLLINLDKSDRLIGVIIANDDRGYANRQDQYGRRTAIEHWQIQSNRPRRPRA